MAGNDSDQLRSQLESVHTGTFSTPLINYSMIRTQTHTKTAPCAPLRRKTSSGSPNAARKSSSTVTVSDVTRTCVLHHNLWAPSDHVMGGDALQDARGEDDKGQ